MIRHLPRLDPDEWYVIDVDRGEKDRRPWESRYVALHGPNIEASIEWSLLRHGFGLGAIFGRNGGESHMGLDLHVLKVANVWLRFRSPWTKWLKVSKQRDPDGWYNPRHTGVELFPYHGCILRVRLDSDDNARKRRSGSKQMRTPREWSLTTYMLMGKRHHETVDGDAGVAQIPLPEGVYDASWQERISTATYVGRRFGRIRDLVLGPHVRRWIDLKIEGGIPIEGKGENSWDCGMDGLFGSGGRTVEDAIGSVVASVLRDRRRYGGPHNLPRPMTVSEAGAQS